MSKKQDVGIKVAHYIEDEFLMESDNLINVPEIIKKLDLMVDNGVACKQNGYAYENTLNMTNPEFHVACQFMIDHNKKLKKYRTISKRSTFKSDPNINQNKELLKMADSDLSPGTYFAIIKEDNYAVLNINTDSEDKSFLIWNLYFVGHSWQKYKQRFLKKIDKIKDMLGDIIPDNIRINGVIQETQFKSFDKMIFTGKDEIISYVDNWVEHIPDYFKYGIQPKLSILLYGAPGTGKSTVARALAKKLGIHDVIIKTPKEFEPEGEHPVRYHKSYIKAINVIDDIDCITFDRDKNDREANMVLSNLLAFLDNPPAFDYKAKDGVYYPISIVVSTTNYYDKLDPAVKRYGRFDFQKEMKELNSAQAEELCRLYDLHLNDVYHEKYDENTLFSPAYIQALCLANLDGKFKGTI